MKKTLLAILVALCSVMMVLGFASCEMPGPSTQSSSTEVTYTLDSNSFNKIVAYKGTVNYATLKLKGSDNKSVNVTNDMVSDVDTNSVGVKQLTVTYKGVAHKVEYTVKYEVKFMANGTSLGTQYVLAADEIEVPNGYEMDEWEPAIPVSPQTISDNMTFVYKDGSSLPVGTMTVTLEDKECSLYVGAEPVTFSVSVSPATARVRYEVTSSNDNVQSVYNNSGFVIVNATKIGVSEVTVKAINVDNEEDYAIAKKTVVVMPATKPTVVQSANTYGIEKTFTFGGVNADGSNSSYQLSLALGDESKIGAGYRENITWGSSDEELATINSNGVITRGTKNGVGIVEFTAKFMVNGVEYAAAQPYAIRYVSEGVNVSNYDEVYAATKAEKPIVLTADIAFPTNKAAIKYETIHTTYDDEYYVNKGTAKTEAEIMILLQFKNDLYGNGYVINAHNATAGLLDPTGAPTDALFKGPLNFVAMGEANSGLISVKAQDNVCFALYEGVTANNVELRGCDLETDENGNYDLTDLDYIGTTVEVFGDDVTIEYSRITNGRTVLRVFGDAEDKTKVIHLNIKNSVLSGAREFIIRMGSNCFVQGTDANRTPFIGDDNASTQDYQAKTKYNRMTAAEKAAYDEKYIKTFVHVKDSVFKDAGIFAVGIDSHFAGKALHDGGSYGSILGTSAGHWKNLAKTSYGAKLTFEGDVRLYNWKRVDEIDSSTLLDNRLPETSMWKDLRFDVHQMISKISEKENFGDIVTKYKDEDYVHAGIAFFGGGKNYGVFENSGLSEVLVNYTVSLDDVGHSMLKTAAGEESFYFMLCDATSSFSPQKQEEMLNSDDAYSCIYKK